MAKADFTEIYHAPDPRAYYTELGELGYQVPAHASPVFDQLVDCLRGRIGRDAVRVTDLCCSYGVNAALMKFDVGYSELVEHYTDPAISAFDTQQVIERDRKWFAERSTVDPVEVVGIDVSAPAIEYATTVGLLNGGGAEDLEAQSPSEALAAEVAGTDLITVTGGIGYITEQTVGSVIDAASTDGQPWVAALSLDWVDFSPVSEAAAARGFVTEKADGVAFPQRRFASTDEQAYVVSELESRGIDPGLHEATGCHLANLYLLRPEADATAEALDELLLLPQMEEIIENMDASSLAADSPS